MLLIYTNFININFIILIIIIIDIKRNYYRRQILEKAKNRKCYFYIKKIINFFLNLINVIKM